MKDGMNLDILYYLENVAYILDSQNLQNLLTKYIGAITKMSTIFNSEYGPHNHDSE